ncbi:hypothetical protein QFE97_03665 [Bacillus subtilis]|nr:hypothetical protein QFE97_03665 [Bacillus subtilis]
MPARDEARGPIIGAPHGGNRLRFLAKAALSFTWKAGADIDDRTCRPQITGQADMNTVELFGDA